MKIAKILFDICEKKNENNRAEIDYLILESKSRKERKDLIATKEMILNSHKELEQLKDYIVIELINNARLLRLVALRLISDDR